MGFFKKLWGIFRKEATNDVFALLYDTIMALKDRNISAEEKDRLKKRVIKLLEDI